MTEDAELLRRYVAGKSEEAFAELVRRHLDLVYSTALRRLAGDTHLAQDVAQSVFAALARKAPLLTGRATLAGWLYLGAHHAAAQAVRGEQRRRNREQEAHIMHDQLSSSVPTTDWDRVRPVLDAALRELNDADREAVLLRYFERRPFADIGAALQLGEDAARMRVERALEKLRALLARRGVTSTAAALGAALVNDAMVAAPAGLAATVAGSALAGGATVAATSGLFMSIKTITATVVALSAIGLAVYQTNETRRAESAAASLEREHDNVRAQLREARKQAAQAAQQAADASRRNTALERDLDTVFSAKATPVIAAASATSPGTMSFRPTPAGISPDEARRQVRARNIESRDAANAALYQLLGFSPAQHELFKTMIGEHLDQQEARFKAAMMAARAQNPNADRATLQAVMQQAAEDSYAEWLDVVRGTFGDATAQTAKKYQETIAARAVTKELTTALFNTDTPLTVAQAEQLVDIIAANSRNAQGKVDLGAMNADGILAQAQTVLSAPQLAALRRAQAQVQERQADRAAKSPGG